MASNGSTVPHDEDGPGGTNEKLTSSFPSNTSLVGENIELSDHAWSSAENGIAGPAPPSPNSGNAQYAPLGRPPRAPISPPAPQVGTHKRTNTTGDAQIPLKSTAGGHKRTVSWDVDAAKKFAISAAQDTSILMPVLDDGRTPMLPQHRRPRGGVDLAEKLTLHDVSRSGFETEAENAILEALEEMERKKEEKVRALNNPVHVVEEPGWHPGYDEKGRVDGMLPEEEKVGPEASPNVDVFTNSPPRSKHSSAHSSVENSPKSQSPSDSVRPKPNYAAKQSMRDLAQQVRMMQMGAGSARFSEEGYLKNAQRNVNDEPIAGAPGAPPISSADVLVNNASILFQRKNTPEHSAEEQPYSNENFDPESQRSSARSSQDGIGNRPRLSRWAAKARLSVIHQFTMPDEDDASEENELQNGSVKHSTHLNVNSERGNDDDKDGKLKLDEPDGSSRRRRKKGVLFRTRRDFSNHFALLREVLKPKKHDIIKFLKTEVFVIFVPVLAISAGLFYGAGNPLLGDTDASWSWWLQFLLVRQLLTLSLSKSMEIFFIEYLTLRTRFMIRLYGPFITLCVAQSRGWPYILIFWAVWDFGLLYGNNQFANHWLYYQDAVGMFNAENPSGDVTQNNIYFRVLIAAIVLGAAAALKRVWLAMYLGRRSYEHYGPQLEKIMRKMVLISEVSYLSKEILESANAGELDFEHAGSGAGELFAWKSLRTSLSNNTERPEDFSEDESLQGSLKSDQTPQLSLKLNILGDATSPDNVKESDISTDTTDTNNLVTRQAVDSNETKEAVDSNPANKTGKGTPADSRFLKSTQRAQLFDLLEEWEEPEIKRHTTNASINDVLQYRQALSYMDDSHPFSIAFGPAKTRNECIESAQLVYERLLLLTPGSETLPFETISLIALDSCGELQKKKVKALIKLFRPDRDGGLSLLDFVKSIDSVYKELRLFRAATANSSQIDVAFETIVNVGFYFIMAFIILAIMSIDPVALFLSLSSLLLSFSFMFSGASSKYFEGLLLIFVRRPYDIGDRVSVSDVNKDTSSDGSMTWFVEGVSLFTTTVRLAATNEVATYSNGSLANSRIINAARSPKATVYLYLKFGLDVPYEKVKIFRTVIESFVKARPREWIAMNGFRATRVQADLAFIEYVVVLGHRESWQSIGIILQSKADVASYCLEVTKKMDMRYSAPSLPVELALGGMRSNGVEEEGGSGNEPSNPTDSPMLRMVSGLFPQSSKKK